MRKVSKILLVIAIILSFVIVPQTAFAKSGGSINKITSGETTSEKGRKLIRKANIVRNDQWKRRKFIR